MQMVILVGLQFLHMTPLQMVVLVFELKVPLTVDPTPLPGTDRVPVPVMVVVRSVPPLGSGLLLRWVVMATPWSSPEKRVECPVLRVFP